MAEVSSTIAVPVSGIAVGRAAMRKPRKRAVRAANEGQESALVLAEKALHMYESEPCQAERLARRALQLLDGDGAGDPRARSMALQALGMVAWERQSIAEALDALRLAIAVASEAGQPNTAAHARSSLALVLSYAGDDAGALAEAATAAPFLVGSQRAELQHHMAGILEREGCLREALELETRALRTFRRLGNVLWQAKSLNNRGIMLAQLGEVMLAQRQFAQAEELYDQLGMTLGRLKTRNNRAWAASLRGDVPGALQLHDGLQRELEALGVPPGLFRLDQAGVLLAASLPTEALAAAEQAARELADEGMALDAAEALLFGSLAARLAGSFEAAESLGRRAADAFEAQSRPAWALRARHASIEAAWVAGRHDLATEEIACGVAAALERAGWMAWAREVHLLVGQMALARGDVEEAAVRLRLARPGTRAEWSRAAQLAGLEARLHAARGDLTRARRTLRRGLQRYEKHEAVLGATELRVRAATQAADLADLGLRWALASGRAANVLVWAERRRATALRLPPVRPPRNRTMEKLLATRRAASLAADQSLLSQDFAAGPNLGEHKRIAQLDAQIRDLARTTDGAGRTTSQSPTSPRALAAALGGRALLELVAIDDDLLGVTVIDGRFQLHPLASLGEVQTELEYMRFALGRAAIDSRRSRVGPVLASLDRLDQLVMTPLRNRIGDRELVIVPVASLHTLPWGSLPSLQDRAVSVAPSATTWLRASTVPPRPRASIVVVAGPGLDHAEAEAIDVARAAHARRTLVGAAATASSVARALDGAAVAHLACHGHYRSDNPLLSSLLLADGPLTVYELERLHRAPLVVVLSACDSAVGSASAGDELMGLAASLLALGSRALIGAIAPVRDERTRPLMLAFHEQLAAGRTPAAALARAKSSIGTSDPGAFATSVSFGCFGAGN